MSASKHFDKICCIILCFTLLITLLFLNAEDLGVLAASTTIGYENRLFDTSKVHTIDIVMDDWDGFIENCTQEEYTMCSVIIDGEAYKNVGIRAKGNTSLSSVASYGNNRYSFKIEFDQYDDTKSYYGLDKLSLNNIIQDNTYMKDYLVYQMMGKFGVASPLCSYAYITVNGEDFGLYLAVEAVEDSFLARNYGNDYGDLYKPDNMSMGGGRGNGKDFDMDTMEEWFEQFENMTPPTDVEGNMTFPDMGGMQRPQGNDNMTFPDMNGMQQPEGREIPDTDNRENRENRGSRGGMGNFGGGGFGGMGGDDVSLIYSDDSYDSYSNIFDNAKTTVTNADKDRLIASLKNLNENTDIETVVNVEDVIRYFVVHNFALNFDSYTGSIIHNYYLYEENGKMEMIPWDYNLAFGGFMSQSDATSLVNYPIDSPVSGGTVDSRPMLAWIFANEEYTELYHKYFAEFLAMFFSDCEFEEMIDTISEMITPYIDKQPTEFCTYEEFETGIATLKEFCLLRAESINGQLAGTIPSTSEGQAQDNFSRIDASTLNTSDMGSMGNMGGGGFGDGNKGGFDRNFRALEDFQNTVTETSSAPSMPDGQMPNSDMPAMAFPGNERQTSASDVPKNGSSSAETSDNSEQNRQFPNRDTTNLPSGFDKNAMFENASPENSQGTNLILLGISVLVLAGGLTFAILYGRKRH